MSPIITMEQLGTLVQQSTKRIEIYVPQRPMFGGKPEMTPQTLQYICPAEFTQRLSKLETESKKDFKGESTQLEE